MFDAFERLQDIYRNEAAEWIKGQTLPVDAPYPDKIEFAVSSVRGLDVSDSEKVQRAYYRCRAVLGDEADSISSGDFQKPLMRYFLNHQKVNFNKEQGYLEDYIKRRFVKDVVYDDDEYGLFSTLNEKPLKAQPVFQKFLDAGEIKELAEVLLDVAYSTDGKKDIPERQKAMNKMVAKVIAELTHRTDVHESDIEMLRADGAIVPKPIWQSDFYLDHVVEPVSDALRENARLALRHRFPEDSVFWKVRDKLTDKELFSLCINTDSKDLEMKNWVSAMATFEVLTGRPLTIRQALSLDPQHPFSLAHTSAFKEYLDNEGAQDPSEYQTVELDWEDEGYDKESEVYRSTVTLQTKAFLLPEVEDQFCDSTRGIGAVRATTKGVDAFICELEFESKKEMLKERQGVRIALQKNLQEILKDIPMPGDTVSLVIPEGYEAEDVEVDGLRIGDTRKVTACGYFGGSTPAYKLEGIGHCFGIEELEVESRPKLSRKPSNEPSGP